MTPQISNPSSIKRDEKEQVPSLPPPSTAPSLAPPSLAPSAAKGIRGRHPSATTLTSLPRGAFAREGSLDGEEGGEGLGPVLAGVEAYPTHSQGVQQLPVLVQRGAEGDTRCKSALCRVKR